MPHRDQALELRCSLPHEPLQAELKYASLGLDGSVPLLAFSPHVFLQHFIDNCPRQHLPPVLDGYDIFAGYQNVVHVDQSIYLTIYSTYPDYSSQGQLNWHNKTFLFVTRGFFHSTVEETDGGRAELNVDGQLVSIRCLYRA